MGSMLATTTAVLWLLAAGYWLGNAGTAPGDCVAPVFKAAVTISALAGVAVLFRGSLAGVRAAMRLESPSRLPLASFGVAAVMAAAWFGLAFGLIPVGDGTCN